MSDQVILAIIGTLGVVLGGAGVKLLINRWFARERERLKLAEAATKDGIAAAGEKRRLLAADHELRASMLQDMVETRDQELQESRARELKRETEIGDIRVQLARLEERSSSQAVQIAALQAEVARWNHDYEKMEVERNQYRDKAHELANQLTPLSGRLQLAERELLAKDQEIERLKGQLDVLTSSRGES